jgi:two-component system, cell cycle sensor histidine kinase and response regulator CckA
MSGYTEDVVSHHGMLDEGIAFLRKPFTVAELAQKMRMALDSGTVLC